LPVFRTKKEPFEWLKIGKKTIDVRKGEPLRGEIAVFLSGRNVLRMKITKRETGRINEVLRADNFRLVVPSAVTIEEAIVYLARLYDGYLGIYAAYHVAPLVN